MSRNLATVLTESAERDGDAVAIKLDDAELTYKQLDGASAHVAGLLRSKGVEPGDRVGIMLPNVPYFPVVYYGVLRLGAVVVPMNVLLKGREVEFYLKDPEAKVLFAWHDFAEAAEKGASGTDAEVVLVKPGEFEDTVGSADKTLKFYDGAVHDPLNDLGKEEVLGDITTWISTRTTAGPGARK